MTVNNSKHTIANRTTALGYLSNAYSADADTDSAGATDSTDLVTSDFNPHLDSLGYF